MNPKAICAEKAFHHPHDMQAFYRLHNAKRLQTGPHTPWPNRAENGVYDCSKSFSLRSWIQPLKFWTRPLCRRSHPAQLIAQGSNSEKHPRNSEWENAYGIGYGKETKTSHGPSFHESRTAHINTNQAGPSQWRNSKDGYENASRSPTARRLSSRSCWKNEICASRSWSRRRCISYWQEDSSNIQQGRKSRKWLKAEIIAVKSSMGVICTGASNFQVNVSKLRRALDTVDLWKTSRFAWANRSTCAVAFLWSSNGCLELLSLTILIWALSLDRQGLLVAAPVNLRTKKNRKLLTIAIAGLLSNLKEKNPKIVVIAPTVTTQNSQQKEVIWQQCCLCLSVAGYQILGGVHIFSRWDQNQERFGVWKKVQHLQKKYNCQWTLLRGKKPKWILHNFGNLLQPLASVPDSRKHVVPTEWPVPTVLGRLCFQGKGYFNSSATVSAVRAGSVTSWILPIWPYEKKQHWPLWQARRWAVYLKIWQQMFDTPFTNANHWAQGKSWSVTGIHRQLHWIFLRIWQSFDVIFCRICTSSAVWFSRANLEAILTPLRPAVNPLLGCTSGKPLSRQIGVRVCPAARFNFSAPHLIREDGQWLCSGKKISDVSPSWLHLRTKEEMRPVIRPPPKFFDDPDVPFGPPPESPWTSWTARTARTAWTHHQDGLQLQHLLVIEKECNLKVHHVSGYLYDLHHPSLNLFRFQ